MTLLLAVALQTAASPPPDYDRSETLAEAEASAAVFHRRMDANGDGYLTRIEMERFAQAAAASGPPPATDAVHPLPPVAKAMLEAADTDHDGRVSTVQAVAGAKRALEAQDLDHDGIVTPAERTTYRKATVSSGASHDDVPILMPGPGPAPAPDIEGWHPPAQAVWPSGNMPIVVTLLHADEPSMIGKTVMTVVIAATGPGVAISRFVQTTRGIDLIVTGVDGRPVAPGAVMVGSPPPPPLPNGDLTPILPGKPFTVTLHEWTRTIFPAPGRYMVRALLTLFDPTVDPVHRARLLSAPVAITVTR